MRKRIIYLFYIAFIPLSVIAQDEIGYAYTIGINSGIDNNINGFREAPNLFNNNFYKGTNHYNIGIDFGIMVAKKIRPRFELKYVKMGYNAGWENANLPSMSKSIVKLFNLDFNFNLDYLLLDINKFQMFISPGLKWEINIDREERNIKLDNTYNYSNYNEIINENPRSILGSSISTIFKYNITKNVGFTITPEYTMFLRRFLRINEKNYQRTSINLGLEYNFY